MNISNFVALIRQIPTSFDYDINEWDTSALFAELTEIVHALAETINESGDQKPEYDAFHDLEENLANAVLMLIHIAEQCGVHIEQVSRRRCLTPQEHKLWCYLVKNIGCTCTRAKLENALWGEKFPGTRDALEQLVMRIRRKIKAPPEAPEHLITVRGIGYMLRKKK